MLSMNSGEKRSRKKRSSNTKIAPLLKKILQRRGVKNEAEMRDFLHPNYEKMKHGPFLIPDMAVAVERIAFAKKRREKVMIYGDYDIDGMTATVILWESLNKFGIRTETYTPDRFREGYGLNNSAIDQIAKSGAKLIITVDNGTLSFDEIDHAKNLGIDVIVTDHHTPHDELPNAVAVLNLKRLVKDLPEFYDENFILKKYPPEKAFRTNFAKKYKLTEKNFEQKLYSFCDLSGVGVAFKLVQALQTKFAEIPDGQEKWLLDLVALGTVCDIVGLVDENRANVKWGIEVLKKTRRTGLKALLAMAKVDQKTVDARTLGFVIGPRLNASGRMETAEFALEILKLHANPDEKKQRAINARALKLAEKLEKLNQERRNIQDEIFREAEQEAMKNRDDPVIVAAGENWHEGVIGIVAAKLVERFEKPAFVFSVGADFAKASGRSFGEFSMAAAIAATGNLIEKGGGHLAAGGLTMKKENLAEWKKAVQEFYRSLRLKNQREFLYPKPDVVLENFAEIDLDLVDQIEQLQPFGNANEAPVFLFQNVAIRERRLLGAAKNHVKFLLEDDLGNRISALAFSGSEKFPLEPHDQNGAENRVDVLLSLEKNEWNGFVSVEGKLLRMEISRAESGE